MGPERDGEYVRTLLREMPEVELHLHLDGALGVSTALELAWTPPR